MNSLKDALGIRISVLIDTIDEAPDVDDAIDEAVEDLYNILLADVAVNAALSTIRTGGSIGPNQCPECGYHTQYVVTEAPGPSPVERCKVCELRAEAALWRDNYNEAVAEIRAIEREKTL